MLFAHSLPVLGWQEALLRLALAAALGGVIGIERERIPVLVARVADVAQVAEVRWD